MATEEQCRDALRQLAARLGGSGDRAAGLDRSMSCHVPDLGVTFRGRLRGGQVEHFTTDAGGEKDQIRFTVSSDDLVDIAAGRLDAGSAFASGRLKINASIFDLLKLKSML
ncbi:MAG: SCP2 sterol-binding domain-containing protein [Actinomycetota bacterium]|nr:SCP2 sterol-binding domain-containing protein [Actinomycetota bacterium]